MLQSIVIIGAGIGGVSCAIALRRQLGLDDFIIYECASDVGGAWRDNIYPGASSDVGIHFYSLSTDLKPDWPSTHGSQPETQEYWRGLTQKYGLHPRIVFNRLVVSAEWRVKEEHYHIITEDVRSGERFSTTAKILISAIGVLAVPHLPNIPGHSSFRGKTFHSARWDTGVDLRGKRVAVIGNGASATQFVPLISEDPTIDITEFCRTPNWFLPPARSDYSSPWKWAFRNVPLALRLYRVFLYFRTEMLYLVVFSNKMIRTKLTKMGKDYITRTAPKKDLERLIPNYTLGCKRMIFDQNFLAALHRPNLRLNWDGIQSFCEDGIITKKGDKLPFDIIIFATGFVADQYPISITGDTGETVQQYYDSQGGPKAYLGGLLPGFPNFFLVQGPNTSTGHTSVILTEELQINYFIQLIEPILNEVVSTFTVTARATDLYNERIQGRLARSVFVDCLSWYRTGGDGKVSSIFPGSMMLFWWWVRRPRWTDFAVKAAIKNDEWGRRLRRERWRGAVLDPRHYLVLLLGALVFWITLG